MKIHLPTEEHQQAMKKVADRFRQFERNGRWGKCVDCPHDANYHSYPEFCKNSERMDHHLTIEDLVENYKVNLK